MLWTLAVDPARGAVTVTESPRRFPWRDLLLVLLAAAAARALVLASGAVSFHSDEAIVGLMARHIGQGARPVFFYGQVYMGTLDSWLVAAGFSALGESVLTIRLAQSALYLLTVLTAHLLAWRLTQRRAAALMAGLTFALPPALVTVYTSASLGGYGEVLLLGNLTLLLALPPRAATGGRRRALRGLLLGLCAGLGWWVNGLMVVYLLPAAAVTAAGLLRGRTRGAFSGAALAAAGFVVGSAPWWAYDFAHDHAALRLYLGAVQSAEYAGQAVSGAERLAGLALFGLPAATGLRFPWATDYFAPLWGLVVLALLALGCWRLLRTPLIAPAGRALVGGVLLTMGAAFTLSSFGADPTGRFFLPLLLPLAVGLGVLVTEILDGGPGRARRGLAAGLAALVLGYWAAGTLSAVTQPPGLTTQFTAESHIANDHDAALIAFLEAHDLARGYTHYWVAYRLAFLSGERLQYSPALPYRADLRYNPLDDRYPPYTAAAEQAARAAYITSGLPALDAALAAHFAGQGVTFQRARVGPYTVYYDFAPFTPRPPRSWPPAGGG